MLSFSLQSILGTHCRSAQVSASTNLLKRYVKDLDQTEDELLEARKLCRAVDQTVAGLSKHVVKCKHELAQVASQWELKLA